MCVVGRVLAWSLETLGVRFGSYVFLAVLVWMEVYCSALFFHDGSGNIEDDK